MPVSNELAPGYKLGKYRILSEIGRGGMGVVYLGEDTLLSRQVAIKVLPSALMADDAFIERFRREAKVIAAISHPNVVSVHSFDVIDGIPVIDMEYIEGGSLADRLRQGGLTAHDVVRYAYGIASALAYCHSLEAIHLDVKPSNILIDKLDRARLADFGIAKALAGQDAEMLLTTLSGVFHGTPHYAPPEAWEGASPSYFWDTYALGAVIYESLTGAPPYQASSPMELIRRLATEDLVPPKELNPNISQELNDFVVDMLEPDLHERVPSAGDALRRISELPEYKIGVGNTTHTYLPLKKISSDSSRGRSSRRRVRARRRKMVLYLAIAAVIAAVTGFGAASFWVRNAPPGSVTRAHNTWESNLPLSPTVTVPHIMSLWRDLGAGTPVVLDAQYSSDSMRQKERWLLLTTVDGEPQTLFIHGPGHIAKLEVQPDQGERSQWSGEWAAYADHGATRLRYGTVRGELRWDAGHKTMIGALRYFTQQTGAAREFPVSAAEEDETASDTHFVFQLEESPYILPLLNRELMPRGHPLAASVTQLMPFFPNGRLRASRAQSDADHLDDAGLPALLGRLDGELIEAPGSLGALFGDAPAGLQAAYSDAAFYCHLSLAADVQALRVSLRLMREYFVPLSESPVLHLVFDSVDGGTREYYGAGQPQWREGACIGAARREGGRWLASFRVPYAAFGQSAAEPAEHEQWRLTATVYAMEPNGAIAEILCRWGLQIDGQAAHGAVVSFAD